MLHEIPNYYHTKFLFKILITIRINFSAGSEVSDVSFDMIASDGSLLNSSPVPLFDNNDNRFANQFPMSEYYPNGKWYLPSWG